MQHADGTSPQKIREALRDIIEGKHVKRVRHELIFEGIDLRDVFVEELRAAGYLETTVAGVNVQPGERAPAFRIDGQVAYFGWVFWEQFTSWKLRKLWGSDIRNAKGDWEIQIPPSSAVPIYCNESKKIEMDIDHPGES